MYRSAIEKLKKWKESYYRKPMIIEGARQVGKTWLMKEFGKDCYKNTVYINFDSNKQMKDLFSSDLNIERIIMGLEIYSDTTITPDDTLIIFDEVQEVPAALSSLKYFYENAPQYHIICAGSLLGISLHEGTSFPVGKVDFLKLYPLSFDEFLLGTGYEKLYKLLNSGDYALINSSHIIKILMRFAKCKSESSKHTSKTFPSTRRRISFRKSAWYGTAFPRSLPRRIRSLSTV